MRLVHFPLHPDTPQTGVAMGDQGEKGAEFTEGHWGSGLLWPVLRIAAMVLIAAAVVHWVIGTLSTGAPPARTMAVSELRDGQPAYAAEDAGGEIVLHANRSGQFLLNATVNGENIRFLVDTGADQLTLSPDDARRIGLNIATLTFSERYQTANGVAVGAPVKLREFRVGAFTLYDLRATVLGRPMPVSLLGMSVLSRFAGHEMEGNKLVLRW